GGRRCMVGLEAFARAPSDQRIWTAAGAVSLSSATLKQSGGLNLMERWKVISTHMIMLACACFFSRALPAAEWKDKAEAEGKVVLYTTANTSDTKTMTDSFRKVYPKIDVQFDRTSDSQLMEKILNEARAGTSLWDVVSTTGFYGYLLKKRGLLAPYDSPERKYFRDGFKDPQAYWTSTYTTYAVFGFNTRLVSKVNVPRSHEDLLKPFWKGQVGIEGRGYEWFTATISGMGKEKGLRFMRALASQKPDLRIGRTL